MAKQWGGKRPRAGRPKGSGGPPELVRRNRVVVMLTDAELVTLEQVAEGADVPVATAAYEIVARSLRRRARGRGPSRSG